MSKRVGGFINQDGLNAPDAPTSVSGTAGDEQVDVSFTAPSDVGGAAVSGYRVTDTTGAHGASGSSSPITVTGLTNGTEYTFNVWAINPFGWSSPSDASGSVSPAQAAYALVGGFSISSTYSTNVDRYNISVQANATDFGDLTLARSHMNGIGGTTRIIFVAGRNNGSNFNTTIDYANPTSQSNFANFGDLSAAGKQYPATFGNSTRGISAGGEGPSQGAPNYQYYDNIEYLTIATTGNTIDFGDLTEATQVAAGCINSPTRGIRSTGAAITGGGSSIQSNVMDYVTIATTGNATDFGDNTSTRYNAGGCSSSTRGLTAGGNSGDPNYTNLNVIDYVTIASTGNATDFGDLFNMQGLYIRGAASETKATFFQQSQTICQVTIASTGNATDFADLTNSFSGNQWGAANSNAHGGLS